MNSANTYKGIPQTLFLIIVLTILYFIFGYIGLRIAVPPGYAATIWPSAGIALGFTLVFGLRVIPGAFFGELLVNVVACYQNEMPLTDFKSIFIYTGIGFGAMLECLVGFYLVKYFLRKQFKLHSVKEILLFFALIGPIACLVNSTIGNSVLYSMDVIPNTNIVVNWFTWWSGDALGAMTFTPLILYLFAKPKEIWRTRSLAIFLPIFLTVASGILIAVFIGGHETKRIKDKFSHEVAMDIANTKTALNDDILITNALKEYLEVTPTINQQTFETYAKRLRKGRKYIEALQWVPKVTDRQAFLGKVRKYDKDFHIKQIKNNKMVRESKKNIYYPILYSYPKTSNKKVEGFDLNSDIKIRHILHEALEYDEIEMSSPIKLIQDSFNSNAVLLAIPVTRNNVFTGFATSVVNMPRLFDNVFLNKDNLHEVTILDKIHGNVVFSYHSKSKEYNKHALKIHTTNELTMLNKTWTIKTKASNKFIAANYSFQVWIDYTIAIFLSSLVGIILFIIYGQKHYIAQRNTSKQQVDKKQVTPEVSTIIEPQRSTNHLNIIKSNDAFLEILPGEIEKAKASNELLAVLSLEINNMSDLCIDSHSEDDVASKILVHMFRRSDIITQTQAGHFLILCKNIFSRKDLEKIINRHHKLSKRFAEQKPILTIGASIFPLTSEFSIELIEQAILTRDNIRNITLTTTMIYEEGEYFRF